MEERTLALTREEYKNIDMEKFIRADFAKGEYLAKCKKHYNDECYYFLKESYKLFDKLEHSSRIMAWLFGSAEREVCNMIKKICKKYIVEGADRQVNLGYDYDKNVIALRNRLTLLCQEPKPQLAGFLPLLRDAVSRIELSLKENINPLDFLEDKRDKDHKEFSF